MKKRAPLKKASRKKLRAMLKRCVRRRCEIPETKSGQKQPFFVFFWLTRILPEGRFPCIVRLSFEAYI
ncbi:hypothetical protein BP422_13810 [Brevibacillus formosus]|uniref:Uncharacterized protein n=1 Tax=Brevibacillus formosus TaxID=54913 RepID=A0A220MIY3_9BACL|nr:hypothetical protein BP422_13810 [Brevibacillus formosus]